MAVRRKTMYTTFYHLSDAKKFQNIVKARDSELVTALVQYLIAPFTYH